MKERGRSPLEREKALIVSRNLPPTHGGIERLMQEAIAALAKDFDCYVIGTRGSRAFLPAAVRVVELPAALPWFHLLAVWPALWLGSRHHFAVCVAASGLVAPLAALAARLRGRPWVAFVHGLDLVAPSRIYQRLFVPILRRARFVIANSQHTRELALRGGLAPGRVRVIPPGVALPPDRRDAAAPALGPASRLLSVGRLVPRKGFAAFITRALPAILAECPEATYVVVGDEPRRAAVAATGTRDEIMAAARSTAVAARVVLAGGLPQAELEAAYESANVLVFPSSGNAGDVEGFGMVILEAAARGVPAVAFDSGGVRDAMSKDNGILVPDGDFVAFAQAVVTLLKGEAPGVTPETCRRHAGRFAWTGFAQAVRRVAVEARDGPGRA